MEAHLKDIGSMGKLAVLECSERQLKKCSRVSGSKTKQPSCVCSDRIMGKRCLVIQTTEWIPMTRSRKTSRMVRGSRYGATEAITMATLKTE